jgi:hypothetical protein
MVKASGFSLSFTRSSCRAGDSSAAGKLQATQRISASNTWFGVGFETPKKSCGPVSGVQQESAIAIDSDDVGLRAEGQDAEETGKFSAVECAGFIIGHPENVAVA